MSFNWEDHPEIVGVPEEIYLFDDRAHDLIGELFTDEIRDGNHTDEWHDAWDNAEDYLWENYHIVLADYWSPDDYGDWYELAN